MNNPTKKLRASTVFNAMAIGLIISASILYIYFDNTKNRIFSINTQANLEYVASLANNLSKDIIRVGEKNLYALLKDDDIIKEYIESDLKLFVTTKYKYIYLVSQDNNLKNSFSILADSSKNKDEKNKLLSMYNKLDKQQLIKIYTSKKYLYLNNTSKDGTRASYLNPIIIDGIVEAIVVVEFSLQEQNTIAGELQTLEDMFEIAITFFMIIFIFILWFSYIDKKRELDKNKAFRELGTSNKNLELETAKVHALNDSLEHRVKEEIDKNRARELQMIQQARLAQMGEMISMIAHQWRQPLAAISSTSGAIGVKATLDKLDNEIALDLSDKISQYAQHLSNTIDDFRDFFKPNKSTDLTSYNQLIDSVLNIIEVSIATKNITIIKELDSTDNFKSYPNELKQVVLNLIKNAEDILVEKQSREPFIKIKTFKEKHSYILEISDNGGGIPKDIIDKIFDPYFSTKMEKDGTGLGLYMSKMIIQEHCKGTISVINTQDGALFRISLQTL